MSNHPTPEKQAYTVREFCSAFGLSHTTTYELIKAGKLHSVKVAGRRLISRQSALKLLEPPSGAAA